MTRDPPTKKQADGFSHLLRLGSCQWNWVVADATAAFDWSLMVPGRPPTPCKSTKSRLLGRWDYKGAPLPLPLFLRLIWHANQILGILKLKSDPKDIFIGKIASLFDNVYEVVLKRPEYKIWSNLWYQINCPSFKSKTPQLLCQQTKTDEMQFSRKKSRLSYFRATKHNFAFLIWKLPFLVNNFLFLIIENNHMFWKQLVLWLNLEEKQQAFLITV